MPNALSATEAARKIREGKLTSVDLVKACLKRIDETDGQLHAWAYLDADQALAQAAELDQIRQKGRPLGPLHGVPVGLKDIIDTRSMPTERGTPICEGRQPEADAARQIGQNLLHPALVLGIQMRQPVAHHNPVDGLAFNHGFALARFPYHFAVDGGALHLVGVRVNLAEQIEINE